MKTIILRSLSTVVAIAMLAACGGGGSHSLPPAAQFGTMQFRIVVPSAQPKPQSIRPMYISAATNSVSFQLVSVNGNSRSDAPIVVALNGSNCSGTPTVCTATSSAPAGQDMFVIRTFASTDGTGSALSINGASATVSSGQTTNVSTTLNPIVASLAWSPNAANCQDPTTTCTGSAAFQILDAAGDIIISPGGYVDSSGNQDTITLSCQSGLNFAFGSSNVDGPLTFRTTTDHGTITGIHYKGSGGTAGGSLTCTASDTIGSAAATYTLSFDANGNISWTLQ
ncbi:MAG TPA: hypothetical protein VFO29_11795 [Candidatus Rubrimentiphilum sp.]|nr:hypothetical protein [Candidatus Rubrimentiphilum sp.]